MTAALKKMRDENEKHAGRECLWARVQGGISDQGVAGAHRFGGWGMDTDSCVAGRCVSVARAYGRRHAVEGRRRAVSHVVGRRPVRPLG